MELTVLGTASGSPTPFRGLSSHILRMEKEVFMFDCGENTQGQLARCQLFTPHDITHVFVTHLHGTQCARAWLSVCVWHVVLTERVCGHR